jgi:hypothetical protein
VNDYIRKFGASLNSAMALSLPSKHKQGQSPQYVAFIVLCKGVPFYGYHVGYRLFLKIYMVHPTHKSRLSQCLRSGAVLGTEFDVFEDHIPFLLQFMLDSNLYGCGWVEVGNCLFRESVPGKPLSLSLSLSRISAFLSLKRQSLIHLCNVQQNGFHRRKAKRFTLLLRLVSVLTLIEPTSTSPFPLPVSTLLKVRTKLPTRLSRSTCQLPPS